jgi:hypothetical protein
LNVQVPNGRSSPTLALADSQASNLPIFTESGELESRQNRGCNFNTSVGYQAKIVKQSSPFQTTKLSHAEILINSKIPHLSDTKSDQRIEWKEGSTIVQMPRGSALEIKRMNPRRANPREAQANNYSTIQQV